MKTRILVAVVGIPLLLLVLLVMPTIATGILVAGMSVLAVYELLYVTGLVKDIRLIAISGLMALCVCLWSCGQREWGAAILGLWLYFAAMAVMMLFFRGKLPFETVGICAYAGVVVPLLLSALTRILTMDYGRFYILVPFIVAFGSDSAAYFVGSAIGRHKMAPSISPKKSWEGAVGGFLGGILGMFLYGLILDLGFQFTVSYGICVLIGAMGSVTCILGDLAFSVIKRQAGIKDFGSLLPGHGGILDRFDSMVFVAPLMEALLLFAPIIAR